MNSGIHKIPSLPQEIVEAVNNRSLSIFLGAGVSRLIGCLGWIQLADHFVDKCYELHCINHKQRSYLLQNENKKKVITICYHLLKNHNHEKEFFSTLTKSLEGDKKLLEHRNIYRELAHIPALFITTNADRHFDEFFLPERIVYKIRDFDPLKIDRDKLYHIHGSLEDTNSLVFTVPQYLLRYNDPTFNRFLETIFAENLVLFIGYGMDEFELLDFLIRKFDPKSERELKHFILTPYYKGEEDVLGFDSFYFNSMGIRIIGFEKDEIGHNQLYDVLRYWTEEIKQTSDFLHEDAREIDEVVDNL